MPKGAPLVECPWLFTSHGCNLLAGHGGDHLCLEAAHDLFPETVGNWCSHIPHITFAAGDRHCIAGVRYVDFHHVCSQEPQDSDRCFLPDWPR